MDKLLYTKKPLKPRRRRKEESAMYSLSEAWERGGKESAHGGRHGGFGSIFLWFFLFLILYF